METTPNTTSVEPEADRRLKDSGVGSTALVLPDRVPYLSDTTMASMSDGRINHSAMEWTARFPSLRGRRGASMWHRIGFAVFVSAVVQVDPSAAKAVDGLVVAEGGRAKLPIVVPPELTAAGKLVVEDLALTLKKITGGEFRIVAESPQQRGPAIWVGMTQPGRALRDKHKNRSRQTLLLRCDENGLMLAGTDDAGTRHAVYEWLYRLGCRWYTPYDWGEVLPKIDTLEIEPFALVYASPFVFRHGRAKPRPDPYNTWKRRNHAGGGESGWLWHGGGHSWVKTLIPKENFEEHPGWFALLDGKRSPENLCATNVEVASEAGERVIAWQREKRLKLVCVSPSDHAGLCECGDCRKWTDNEQILLLANAAARRLRTEFPDAYVTFYANYHSYDDPTQLYPGFRPEPNVLPWIVYRFPDWARPIASPTNRRMQKALRYWGRYGNPLGVYTYGGAYSKGYAPTVHCLVKDIPYLRERGVIFMYDGGAPYHPNWALHGLNHYVQNRLLWRPDTDADAMLSEYYRLFFGPAAGTMRAFHEVLEDTMARSREFREDYHPSRACYYGTFPLSVIERAGELLDRAAAEARRAGPAYVRRLAILRRAHEFVRLDTEADSLRLKYGRKRDPALLRRAAGNLEQMIAIIEDPGNKDLIAPNTEVSRMRRRLEDVQKALEGSGTTFGPGKYSYKDHLEGGGKLPLNALSWDGFHFGNWGLELPAGGRGAFVYAFSCKPNCRFEAVEVHLRLPLRTAPGERKEQLEISADHGGTWTAVPSKYNAMLHRGEADITSHVAGKKSFRLRFSAQNDTDREVVVLDLIRAVVQVAKRAASADE